MNKVKLRFITVISLFALLALVLGIAVSALSPVSAGAITYAPTSIFYARTGGEVRAYKANAEAKDAYLTFVLSDEGSVEYHRDLALKWFEAVNPPVEEPKDDDDDNKGENNENGDSNEGTDNNEPAAASIDPETLANPGKAVYLNMTFSFPEVNFTKYTIVFESEEENISKEGKSVNEIVFENTEDGLYVYIINASEQADKDEDDFETLEAYKLAIEDATADITLQLSEELDGEKCAAGEFFVTLNGATIGDKEHSKFTNVGAYYMEYRTSGTANMPMTFKAEVSENAKQKVMMKNLNGQEFVVTNGTAASTADEDGTVLYEGGRVEDNAPAVLVLSEKLYAFTLGQRFSLSYEAIDVCDDSVTVRRTYYMLTKETDEDGNVTEKWLKPSETTDDHYKTLTTSTYFMPPDGSPADSKEEYVSIRFVLDDGRDTASSEYVYLSWYADLDADVVRTIGNEGENNAWDYILVNRERTAPFYTIIDPVENEDGSYENKTSEDYRTVVGQYQNTLNELAKDVSAGDGAYFYLPSLRGLITSDYADYRNLRFSIYYFKPGQAEGASASSETSLRYNNLRFEIDKPGTYKFRILAADAAGNVMQLYYDGKLVNVTSSNIWDIKEIPDFTIEVDYTGAVVEDAGEQDTGYRGSSYSISDFDIVALEDIEKSYELWYLDEKNIPAELKPDRSATWYTNLVENLTEYFTETYAEYFTEINKYNSDVTEDDADAWKKTDNDYNWNPGKTPGSFTPVEDGYYVVKLTIIDPNRANSKTEAYKAIWIRNPIDRTPTQISWLQNNVTSVVLFSIAALLAVAILVICFVKPSEKSVEDVDLAQLKGNKK